MIRIDNLFNWSDFICVSLNVLKFYLVYFLTTFLGELIIGAMKLYPIRDLLKDFFLVMVWNHENPRHLNHKYDNITISKKQKLELILLCFITFFSFFFGIYMSFWVISNHIPSILVFKLLALNVGRKKINYFTFLYIELIWFLLLR